ncbi:hypothetical protein ACFWVM_04180 [Nocardia fluminea]|uniref:hypothetical protein n=1 Tax=Nocardia fluminea TaxID=134984 RepID=UPI00364794B2
MDEDPDIAQARVFLDELDHHARKLSRAIGTAPTNITELRAELGTIRTTIAKLHARFPETRAELTTDPGAPPNQAHRTNTEPTA